MKRTKEEIIATKAEMAIAKANSLAELTALVSSYNAAVDEDKIDEIKILTPKLTEKANDHAFHCRQEFIYDCLCTDDPMMEAVKRVYFKSVAVKDDRPKGAKPGVICKKKLEEREIRIDLYDLHAEIDGGIGKDKMWVAMCEKMGFLLSLRVAGEIVNPVDKAREIAAISGGYSMSEVAEKLNMGDTPTSNTKLLKQLQMLVTATIGEEFKAKSHDVQYLLHAFSSFDNKKTGNIKVSKPKRMRHIVLDILHAIVEGNGYTISGYKMKK